jgi:hypothetical protein
LSKLSGKSDLERERELNHRFLDGGVHLATSEAFFGEECGWFRITFTVEKEILLTALERYVHPGDFLMVESSLCSMELTGSIQYAPREKSHQAILQLKGQFLIHHNYHKNNWKNTAFEYCIYFTFLQVSLKFQIILYRERLLFMLPKLSTASRN